MGNPAVAARAGEDSDPEPRLKVPGARPINPTVDPTPTSCHTVPHYADQHATEISRDIRITRHRLHHARADPLCPGPSVPAVTGGSVQSWTGVAPAVTSAAPRPHRMMGNWRGMVVSTVG